MGKVKKSANSKHDASISAFFAEYISKVSTTSLAELPAHLDSLPKRWPYPRGDLYHWIGALDRFDTILEAFNHKYGLDVGPQQQPFGVSQLLEGSPGFDEKRLTELHYGPDGDQQLIQAILSFTRLLLEKCGNRNLYNSSDRLSDLLNTTSLPLVHTTLRLALRLAQRHREKDRHRGHPLPIYAICAEKLGRLAKPTFYSTETGSKADQQPVSPVKTSKVREKAATSGKARPSTLATNPDDFRMLLRSPTGRSGKGVRKASVSEKDWQAWANLRMTLKPSPPPVAPESPTTASADQSPLARRKSRLSLTEDQNGMANTPAPALEVKPVTTTTLVRSYSDLAGRSISDVLQELSSHVPQAQHYELLCSLRSAYGLLSAATRKLLLEIRLLAITNLACILDEVRFTFIVFPTVDDAMPRTKLLQQTVALLRPGLKDQLQAPLSSQIAALELLGALAKQKLTSAEVFSILGVSLSHGSLLAITQKCVADLKHDGDATDTDEGDEWRELVFGLLKIMTEAAVHLVRNNSEILASPAIISGYVDGLMVRSDKALRIQLKILEFFKSFHHHSKDGLAILSTNKAFDAACDSFGYVVKHALETTQAGQGFDTAFRTPSTDYKIPYMHQLAIRAILDLIHDVSGSPGPHADRVLRDLIDSQTLLTAFRTILENGDIFGAHTWTEVVRCVSEFLHHEPTSYTIISEAGLSRTLLESVTLDKIPLVQPSSSQTEKEDESEPLSTAAGAPASGPEKGSKAAPRLISALPQGKPQGIMPSIEAIQQLAQAFGAICLTNTGFEFFKASGALPKYFEIFESPQHVKAMKDGHLVNIIGSTFDELIRHHPSLKPMVMSAIITMVARVRNICRQKAWQTGAGAKLWDAQAESGNLVYGGSSTLQYEVSTGLGNASFETERRIVLPDCTILVDSPVKPSANNEPVLANMDKDEHDLDATNYLLPVLNFLGPFFETQAPCTSFMEAGGTHFVLDLITLPSLPADKRTFAANNVMYELSNVVHSMAEIKPHIVLPVLLSRALAACQELQSFAENQPHGSAGFFGSFVMSKAKAPDAMEVDTNTTEITGHESIKIVRSMTALYSLLLVISEVFQGSIYGTRASQSSPFATVNLADMYKELCERLGHISAACLREDLALLMQVSDEWAHAAASDDLVTGDDDINGILHYTKATEDTEQVPVPSVNGVAPDVLDSTTGTGGKAKTYTGLSPQEKQSPAFKNLQTLRYLLRGVASSSNGLFTYLSLSFSNKRKDNFQKQSVTSVGRAIASAMISQLRPSFFEHPDQFPTERSYKELHYSYLTLVLREFRQVLIPDQSATQQGDQCMIFPTIAFKETGGFEVLTEIGIELYDELKMCKTSPDPHELKATFFANAGLKITLDILDKLTLAKNVIESSQATTFKNMDPKKAFYFSPSQLLLELRLSSLPLARTIWNSEYIYQASHAVVASSISVFKNVLHGDHEQEACKDPASVPKLATQPRFYTTPDPTRVAILRARGIHEDELAREALFRCWNREADAYEYAHDFARQNIRPRCPIPSSEIDTKAVTDAPARIPDVQPVVDHAETLVPVSDDGPMDDAEDSEDLDDDDDRDSEADLPSRRADIPSILNADADDAILNRAEPTSTSVDDAISITTPTVQTIDTERDVIRQDLVERCLNLLGSQADITFELSELINFGARKLSDETANSYRSDSSHLAIQCLLSLQEDEITESQGKKIAATAHLVALLLQEKDFYDKSQGLLKEVFENLTDFIKVPTPSPGKSAPETMPWIGYILLVAEKMLSTDAEPPTVTWRMPDGLVDSPPPQIHVQEVVTHADKRGLLNAILAILPAVGKDASLALSLTRVLVILTRNREFATIVAEKRNLHKLSIMVKQLSNFDDRLQSAIMIVLRHIVEDEETIRQIMRSEIEAYFTGRHSRQIDATIYSRDLYGLVLRDPEIFLQVTKEKVKIHHFDISSRQQQLMLKPSITEKLPAGSREQGNDSSAPEKDSSALPNNSVEDGAIAQSSEKAPEPKPPVVERSDGLIHFLLSELLNLKDVDEPPPKERHTLPASTSIAEIATDLSNTSTQGPQPTAGPPSAASRPAEKDFKPEDHPFYSYRVFILEALTELLYSYNRTKIDFINFSRKADPLVATPSKPRSGVLNYLLNVLITGVPLDGEISIAVRKAKMTSDWAINVIIALCSKTGEMGLSPHSQRYSTHSQIDDKDDEPDLGFVRRFVLEHAMRAFKDATSSTSPLPIKYSHMNGLSELFYKLMAKPSVQESFPPVHNNSYKVLGRMMFEKNLISVLTSALAEVDLTFSGSKRTIKTLLRPLVELTSTAEQLSLNSASPITSALGATEEDIISSASSSVSEMAEGHEREATPDFFRNSTLGMMEPHRQNQSPSESDEDDEDEDGEEEMYEEGYEDEEMYDDMPVADGVGDGEVVSDEELDEHMNGVGPVEGLPGGGGPLNIELVLDDGGDMDVDSEEDDEDEDDEDEDEEEEEDDDDDEDDGESFMIDGDDAIIEGEINGDNENDSLHGDDADDWMDEDDEEGEQFDPGESEHDIDDHLPGIPVAVQVDEHGQRHLDNLLQVIALPLGGEHPGSMNNQVTGNGMDPEMPIGDIAINEDDFDEDEDDEDDEEELEDHADIVYSEFNEFLGGHDELMGNDDPWTWDEPPPWARRPRHHRAGNMPNFLGRQPRPGADIHRLMARTHRHHNPQVPRAGGAQDGTNPLLQRQDSGVGPRPIPGQLASQNPWHSPAFDITPHGMPQMPPGGGNLIIDTERGPLMGHGGMLDHLMQMISNQAAGGQLEFRFDPSIPPDQIREALLSVGVPHVHRHSHHRVPRDSQFTAVNFVPGVTQDRWQQEAHLLFVNQWVVVIQRVVQPVLAALVPEAIVEEKAALERREAERKREQEERAERERLEAEATAEAERKKKEEEERAAAEAAEKARVEAEDAVLRATAAAEAEDQGEQQTAGTNTEPMEGVVLAEAATSEVGPAGNAVEAEATANRIFTTIRGQQLDITGLSIDAEYLEALPEELREEVIMQQYTAQREQAQEQQATGGNANDVIDPDFLDALPEDLREEVRQAEAHAARRREREAARREAAQAGGPAQAEDMDNDSFLATLPPELRRQILAEQTPEMLAQLDPQYAAEGRAHARQIYHRFQAGTAGIDPRGERAVRDATQRDAKRKIVQMIDRAGVATLLRLMFMPQQGSMKTNLQGILRHVCGNSQTRFDVMSTILSILKEGSADVNAVERSLASLSLRAKAFGPQKTPQPLKRTLSLTHRSGINEEITPLMIIQQCLDSLRALSRNDPHVKGFFLREWDVLAPKVPLSKKGKGKDNRATRFPLNDLICLLDRKVIMDSSICLQLCAEFLATVTSPLIFWSKAQESRQKLAKEAAKLPTEEQGEAMSQTVQPSVESSTAAEEPVRPSTSEDTSMTGAEASTAAVSGDTAPITDEKAKADVDVEKAKRSFPLPVVPDENLKLVAGILMAPECNHATYNGAIESIRSLSSLPGASKVFREELTSHARFLAKSILPDLEELLPMMRDASSGNDLQTVAATKFAPGSDQTKLLRVMKVLDYLYDPDQVDKQTQDGNASTESNNVLKSSYPSLQLGPVWNKLSECLRAVGDKDSVLSFAQILLPLIESLMVVCKNTSLKDAPVARQFREQSVPALPQGSAEDDLEDLFFNFTTEHRKILNEIVRSNPKLMQGNGSFALLVKNPKVLEFDNKRSYFAKQTQSRHRQRHTQPPLQLQVRRSEVFLDSFKSLYFKSAEEMKYGKLSVRFHNEEGVDAGGVSREWWSTLARGMFDPNYALWQPVASDKTTFHPSALSSVNDEHLMFFKFIGRIIGKAVHEGRVLDCHFSRAVYKKILGRPISIKDMESLDIDYYKSLLWILENDITDIISEDFSVVTEVFGEEKVIDLIPGGRNIPVTEENKAEYVQKLVEHRLIGSVKDQLDNFVMGFHDIVPADLVSIFNESELELLISGLPEINVDDWKANTEYHSYSASSQQIQWFWRAVKSFTEPERAALLQFITGTSKVPLNGFKELEGMHGITKCSIHRDPSKERLPSSHTCFNQLDLPEYENYETLKKALLTACELGGNYFGFA